MLNPFKKKKTNPLKLSCSKEEDKKVHDVVGDVRRKKKQPRTAEKNQARKPYFSGGGSTQTSNSALLEVRLMETVCKFFFHRLIFSEKDLCSTARNNHF